MYPNMTETLLDLRTEDIAEVKAEREKTVNDYLADIDTAYRDKMLAELGAGDDIVASAIAAAAAGATIAEIYQALPTEGKAITVNAIGAHRLSERFEKLRKLTEGYKAKTGDNVRVFLANMGPIPQHKARADFTRGFLEVGAFEVLANDGFKTVADAVAAAKDSNADAVVIC